MPPGEYFKHIKGLDVQMTYHWPLLRVREILKNEQYTGAYIAGRSFQDESGSRYRTPKSEWIIIPDKYPAIVSKEVFEQVQSIISQRKRKMQPFNYLLRGKIVCGTCGHAMIYASTNNPPKYRCIQTHANPAIACHKMKVDTAEVEDAVMAIIKIQSAIILESGDLSDLHKSGGGKEQLTEYEKQIKILGEQRQTIYEQFITGEIDRKTYHNIKADFTTQLDRLKNLVASIKQTDVDSCKLKNTANQARAILGETLTQQEIVDTLIEKVHVFPDNHLEITWKVAGFAANI